MEANQFVSKDFKWTLVVDGFAVKRAKQELGINLFKSIEKFEEFMTNLSENPDVYIDLLWILCDEQAKERGLDEVGFARQLRGGTLISSTNAFMSALADFFQNDQLTRAVKLVVTESNRLRKEATKGLEETLDKVSQETQNSKQQTTTTDTSSNSQESSELTPDHVPSVN